jgi:hypothetical protein
MPESTLPVIQEPSQSIHQEEPQSKISEMPSSTYHTAMGEVLLSGRYLSAPYNTNTMSQPLQPTITEVHSETLPPLNQRRVSALTMKLLYGQKQSTTKISPTDDNKTEPNNENVDSHPAADIIALTNKFLDTLQPQLQPQHQYQASPPNWKDEIQTAVQLGIQQGLQQMGYIPPSIQDENQDNLSKKPNRQLIRERVPNDRADHDQIPKHHKLQNNDQLTMEKIQSAIQESQQRTKQHYYDQHKNDHQVEADDGDSLSDEDEEFHALYGSYRSLSTTTKNDLSSTASSMITTNDQTDGVESGIYSPAALSPRSSISHNDFPPYLTSMKHEKKPTTKDDDYGIDDDSSINNIPARTSTRKHHIDDSNVDMDSVAAGLPPALFSNVLQQPRYISSSSRPYPDTRSSISSNSSWSMASSSSPPSHSSNSQQQQQHSKSRIKSNQTQRRKDVLKQVNERLSQSLNSSQQTDDHQNDQLPSQSSSSSTSQLSSKYSPYHPSLIRQQRKLKSTGNSSNNISSSSSSSSSSSGRSGGSRNNSSSQQSSRHHPPPYRTTRPTSHTSPILSANTSMTTASDDNHHHPRYTDRDRDINMSGSIDNDSHQSSQLSHDREEDDDDDNNNDHQPTQHHRVNIPLLSLSRRAKLRYHS